MTRKAFIADVTTAAAEGGIPSVSRVVRGTEDGELDFCYTPGAGKPIDIHILATDVSGYPSDNTFMVYTDSQHAPKVVNDVLEQVASRSTGLKIYYLISQIASQLQNAVANGSQSAPYGIDEEDVSDDDDGDDWLQSPVHDQDASFAHVSPEAAVRLNKRIRDDLRAVRNAGFKVGVIRGMKADSHTSVLSISIQVARLGLSEEAIKAWDLEKQQYIVLLIRFSAGYKSFEAIINEAARSHEVDFRIGVCNYYKTTVTAAMAAFTTSTRNDAESSGDGPAVDESHKNSHYASANFSSLFISSSLVDFMNEQFTSLLKIRHKLGVGWDGAKRYFVDNQGRAGIGQFAVDTSKHGISNDYYSESPPTQQGLSPVVKADHIELRKGDRLSFPLIAMQFFMRYLTRCTEFCLVCHDRTEESFEALKPYVCSKPLCLYQYMSLGFGPSIEHEILTQPAVVDLLFSFCYASAKGRRLREYPTGMSLSVPLIRNIPYTDLSYRNRYMSPASVISQVPVGNMTVDNGNDFYVVKYDNERQQVVFDSDKTCPLRRGDWVVLTHSNKTSTHHRVLEVLFPTARLSAGVVKASSPSSENQTLFMREHHFEGSAATSIRASTTASSPITTPNAALVADLMIYDRNFDELDEDRKAESIVTLLETIPSIREMINYLKQQKHVAEPSLKTWMDRISPSALGLMRWIIASNRSCIVQVDACPGQDDSNQIGNRLDERVSNMNGWVQFRFAQGAPDKEHRFQQALADTSGRRSSTHPTLFAWHGSRLQNWHSIIRTGLDFKDTLNGRACGHGCYHSLDYVTSAGYSVGESISSTWQGSDLKISSAVCLNEIVNAPQEYICSTPHLVVQHVDWIQSRYLFVRVGQMNQNDVYNVPPEDPAAEESSRQVLEIEQDPAYTPKGSNRKPIGVPRKAFPASREFRLKSMNSSRRSSREQAEAMMDVEVFSDEEDVDDLMFLLSDVEEAPAPIEKDKKWKGKAKGRRVEDEDIIMLNSEPRKRPKSLTDFVPDSLDQSTLQMLEPPVYATSTATQALKRELKSILRIQNSTPLHELGWYINGETVNNVYQWIVELHSFDPELPLSKDMKTAGIKSVVLEIRFGKDYPMSPPFVRVVRPRFLPFMQGGGGHVTAGGAMCMELLTNSGWSAASSLESVLLQVRMAICNMEPKPARLESTIIQRQRDYGVGEAMEAYVRACRTHGWEVPKDFKDFGMPGGNSFF